MKIKAPQKRLTISREGTEREKGREERGGSRSGARRRAVLGWILPQPAGRPPLTGASWHQHEQPPHSFPPRSALWDCEF